MLISSLSVHRPMSCRVGAACLGSCFASVASDKKKILHRPVRIKTVCVGAVPQCESDGAAAGPEVGSGRPGQVACVWHGRGMFSFAASEGLGRCHTLPHAATRCCHTESRSTATPCRRPDHVRDTLWILLGVAKAHPSCLVLDKAIVQHILDPNATPGLL